MYLRVTTDEELGAHFLGVMIEANDPLIGAYSVPGWECRHCGWRIGTVGLPPSHDCPNYEPDDLGGDAA